MKTMYQSVIAPGNDTQFLRLLNEADIRLLEYGRWVWTRNKITLTPYQENNLWFVSVPIIYNGLLAARIKGDAKMIRAQEFEYSPDNGGEITISGCGGGAGMIDQGIIMANYGSGIESRRVYKVTGSFPDNSEVTALARFAPTTLIANGDTTRCPDYAALKLMMLAIIFEEENDLERSRSYIADALRSLDNKEKTYRAGAKQALNTNPYGAGVSGIPRIR